MVRPFLLLLLLFFWEVESQKSSLGKDEFVPCDEKMHPERRMSRPPSEDELEAGFWQVGGQQELRRQLGRAEQRGRARNLVLFVGDGMDLTTSTATRVLARGEAGNLVWDTFPHVALAKTYCVDAMVADSACSATALVCGVKCNTATLGVTGAVRRKDCEAMRNTSNHVTSIIRKAQLAGKSTGIVTTTRITHATPAAGYAHTADRDWESDFEVLRDQRDPGRCEDIAEQLIRGETGPFINVLFGGGRAYFRSHAVQDEEGVYGRRVDGVDLIEEWKARNTALGVSWGWAWDRRSLNAINPRAVDYVLGLFEPDHLKYNVDNDPSTKPRLAELTGTAIEVLSKNPRGFVLFVEGGRIDHAHHETKSQISLDETLEMETAVHTALEMTCPEETLTVVTADHGHAFSLSGYPGRGADLRGIAQDSDVDGKPMTVLSYANGPGYKTPNPGGSRYDVTYDNLREVHYMYPATAPLLSETHGGADVAVFSLGPWAHLLSGTFEQHFIEHAMSYAACLGDGLTACSQGARDTRDCVHPWDCPLQGTVHPPFGPYSYRNYP